MSKYKHRLIDWTLSNVFLANDNDIGQMQLFMYNKWLYMYRNIYFIIMDCKSKLVVLTTEWLHTLVADKQNVLLVLIKNETKRKLPRPSSYNLDPTNTEYIR